MQTLEALADEEEALLAELASAEDAEAAAARAAKGRAEKAKKAAAEIKQAAEEMSAAAEAEAAAATARALQAGGGSTAAAAGGAYVLCATFRFRGSVDRFGSAAERDFKTKLASLFPKVAPSYLQTLTSYFLSPSSPSYFFFTPHYYDLLLTADPSYPFLTSSARSLPRTCRSRSPREASSPPRVSSCPAGPPRVPG